MDALKNLSPADRATAEAVIDGILEKAASPNDSSWWPPGTWRSFRFGLPDWSPFEVVQLNRPSAANRLAKSRAVGLTGDDLLDESGGYIEECAAFVNSRYCVLIHDTPARCGQPALWHVQIMRRDGNPSGPERYRDFMRIRDELIGESHEAVEVYPARSRETDVANIYHLWVVQNSADILGVGFY